MLYTYSHCISEQCQVVNSPNHSRALGKDHFGLIPAVILGAHKSLFQCLYFDLEICFVCLSLSILHSFLRFSFFGNYFNMYSLCEHSSELEKLEDTCNWRKMARKKIDLTRA